MTKMTDREQADFWRKAFMEEARKNSALKRENTRLYNKIFDYENIETPDFMKVDDDLPECLLNDPEFMERYRG